MYSSFKHMIHDFLPGFIMITVSEFIEIGLAALAIAALAAIVSGF
jgi:hypothetical protein